MTETNWWAKPTLTATLPVEACGVRVRYWLGIYPDLERACRLDSRLEAAEATTAEGVPVTSAPPTGRGKVFDLVEIKADLDRALTATTERQQRAIRIWSHEGLDQTNVGEKLRISQSAVSYRIAGGIARMARYLVEPQAIIEANLSGSDLIENGTRSV